MNKCSLGGVTENGARPDGFCTCEASCEPHRHFTFGVECMHDGTTEHAHCPQAPNIQEDQR